MCLKHLDLEINFDKLREEFLSETLHNYKLNNVTSYTDSYFDNIKHWHHCYPEIVPGTELKKVVDEVNNKAGQEIISHAQFYRLDANTELPLHRDPMRITRCAISILLDESGPIYFEEIGDVNYRVALMDVSRCLHAVKPFPKDRYQVKLSIAKYSFRQVSEWI